MEIIVIFTLVIIILPSASAAPCVVDDGGSVVKCQRAADPADLLIEDVDVSRIDQLIFRGSVMNWPAVSEAFPQLTTVNCLLINIRCAGSPLRIETDCICSEDAEIQQDLPGITMSVVPTVPSSTISATSAVTERSLLGAIIQHVGRAMISSTAQPLAEPSLEPEGQCDAIFLEGLGSLLARIPSFECLLTFVGGAEDLAGLGLALVTIAVSSLYGCSNAVWKLVRAIIQVCIYRQIYNINLRILIRTYIYICIYMFVCVYYIHIKKTLFYR